MKLKVPIYKQGHNQCGPTSLKMILKYLGDEVPVNKIIKVCGGMRKGKRKGMTLLNMEMGVKKLGYKTESYNFFDRKPSKELILKYLKKKTPVIISVRAFIFFNRLRSTIGHFIVITGYEKGKFYINDPATGKKISMKEEQLLMGWFIHSVNSTKYLLAVKK
ncbi:MAG: C39 family peptidase [Candidatus Nanoarchaeia archaeon]